MIPPIITDAETGEYLTVRSRCHRCWKKDEPQGMWVFNLDSHMIHAAGEGGYTICGIKATDDKWLWQL